MSANDRRMQGRVIQVTRMAHDLKTIGSNHTRIDWF